MLPTAFSRGILSKDRRFAQLFDFTNLTVEPGDDLFWSVINALPGENDSTYGAMTIVLYEDGVSSDRTDIELGRLLNTTSHAPLATYDGMTLTERSLPEATMATFIPPTASCAKFLGYNAIGEWVEANHYTFAGPVRLVFLELPEKPGDSDFVMEIQFPICKRTVDLDLLSIN